MRSRSILKGVFLMVGVLEAGLIVGALGLDIYAYKKMKDAEAAAEAAVRDRERNRFKATAANVQVEVHPEPSADATGGEGTHVQTALTDHGAHAEPTETHAEWKPVTYESVAPVQTHEEETTTMITTTSVDSDEIKKQYRSIADRLDVIDERLNDQDTKISVIETKFDHLQGENEKTSRQIGSLEENWRTVDEQLRNVEIPQDQIEALIDKRFTKSNERLGGQVKEHAKKLAQVEAKLDSHIISAADPALIKRDLRDEFYPLLKTPQTALETHEKQNKAELSALSKRITAARDAALKEAATKATKTEVRRIVASIKTTAKVSARKPIAKAAAPAKKTAKTVVVKKTVRTVKAKKAAAEVKPKSKIQHAVHEFAETRKAKKTTKTGKAGEVTVTTSAPKGVNVSTEVVTGGKNG